MTEETNASVRTRATATSRASAINPSTKRRCAWIATPTYFPREPRLGTREEKAASLDVLSHHAGRGLAFIVAALNHDPLQRQTKRMR